MVNEIELKKIWQTTNEKLEESIVLNRENSGDITKLKVHNFLSSMKPIKIFTLLVGVLWVGIGVIALGGIYVYAFSEANKFFLFSATVQVLLTAIAFVIYIYQLITIYQVDITEPILITQKKLISLKISTLWVTRFLFLQLPIWTTFYWNASMLENGNWLLWIFQGIVTLSFSFIAIWFFFNIKYENKDKKWFQLIFNGKEWTPLMKAMKLSEQIEEYNLNKK